MSGPGELRRGSPPRVPGARGAARGGHRARAAALLIGAIAGTTLAACSSGPDPGPVAGRFLAAWTRGDITGAAALTGAPTRAAADLRANNQRLEVTAARYRLGAVQRSGDTARAAFRATLTLAGLGTWDYQGRLDLRLASGTWRVAWSPADIHPQLHAGQVLARERSLPTRAPLLDGTGAPLIAPSPVVVVGLVPGAVQNLPAVLAALQQATGADPTRVRALVAAAKPDEFVPVITLRQADYQRIKPQIYNLPGVHFRQETGYLAPTPTFGLAVLGRVGPATADALAHAGPLAEPGDEMGLSGLEEVYEQRLAGTPSGAVFVRDAAGHRGATLLRVTGHPGTSVATTIDPRVQAAAEAALAGVPKPAALVALSASTGSIVAAASTPADSTLDRALDGRYPPGSSFKTVTSVALLASGVTADTPVPCPPSAVIDGKRFTNFEGEASGPVPFRVDFAKSCNTAFANLAATLGPDSLVAAAETFGVGTKLRLPIAAFGGAIPAPVDQAELAADAIGQGRVLASPLSMAVVAATVDAGSWHAPVLVTDPAQPAVTPPAATLPAAVDATLHDLMRGVVTGGTGTAANLPGQPVFGKTGTAEFGQDVPPQTHAWFIGFRGDLAFAVVVEGGGVGGQVAAPLAANFLRSLG